MRILLDEVIDDTVGVALRDRGFDAVSVQRDRPALRRRDDGEVFEAAQRERRAVVTENAVDFLRIAAGYQDDNRSHWGLVLTSNRSFPRHHPDQAIGMFVRALEAFLSKQQDVAAPTSMIHWLQPADE